MHYTVELTLACSKDEDISKNNFLGVVAADKIPFSIRYFVVLLWIQIKAEKKENIGYVFL